jgi:hypothetical protein
VSVRRDAPAWVVGAAGLAIATAIAFKMLAIYGMDPTVFIKFGYNDSPKQQAYVGEQIGEVTVRSRFVHDGKFFFAQANDPWYLEPEIHAVVLDRPVYRGQRMLFPMIAGGFGLFSPRAVVWSLLVTNLLALGLGAMVAAKLAGVWGLSTWLGLSIPLNIGLIFELNIGGAGILANMCALAALYALVTERTWMASLLFAAAALSREEMVLFAVGISILWLVEKRELPWRLVVIPLVAMAVWFAYLQYRLTGVSGAGHAWGAFAAPFTGIVEAFGFWITDPLSLALNVMIVAIVLAFVPLALRSRQPIAWAALPFVALTLILSDFVWYELIDFTRILAPVFTAIPFLFAISIRDGSRRDAYGSTQERS